VLLKTERKMDPYQWWWHGFGFMWLFPLFFFICLVVFVVFLARSPWSGGRGGSRDARRETAREILDRRFASGEITKEQYAEMKRTLES
jgi:putative membrane protein